MPILFTPVERKVKLDYIDAIRLQILIYCFINRITVASGELEALSLLGKEGAQDLNAFCDKVAELKIYSSPQSARNVLSKSVAKSLALKEGKGKKKIRLSPQLGLVTEGNLLLDYKFAALASPQS